MKTKFLFASLLMLVSLGLTAQDKEAVKKYRLAGGGKHDAECVQYAMETKGFTTATKTRCAEIIKTINAAMTEAK